MPPARVQTRIFYGLFPFYSMFEPQVKRGMLCALKQGRAGSSSRMFWNMWEGDAVCLSVCLCWHRRRYHTTLCPTAGGEGGERSAQEKSWRAEKQTRYSTGNSAYSAKSTAIACQMAIRTLGCQQPLQIQHISKGTACWIWMYDSDQGRGAAWQTQVTSVVVRIPLTYWVGCDVKSSSDLTTRFCCSCRTNEVTLS